MSSDASPGTVFSLVCQNQSSRSGSFCVFQIDPTLGVSDAQSVAWLVKPAHPTTTVTFEWPWSYDFAWSETGELATGVVAASVQVWPTDLDSNNQVTLTFTGGAFTFEDQAAGSDSGKLYVVEDGTIPANRAGVGIGMAGQATFLTQAQPNLTLVFAPDPQIWLAFGDYMVGEVLDAAGMTEAIEISYPVNVYSMTAILEEDNTWSVAATSEVNAAFVEARVEAPSARWGGPRP